MRPQQFCTLVKSHKFWKTVIKVDGMQLVSLSPPCTRSCSSSHPSYRQAWGHLPKRLRYSHNSDVMFIQIAKIQEGVSTARWLISRIVICESLFVQGMHRVARSGSGSQTDALSVSRPLTRRICCSAVIMLVRGCSTSTAWSRRLIKFPRETGSVLSVSRPDILLADWRHIAKCLHRFCHVQPTEIKVVVSASHLWGSTFCAFKKPL